MAPWSPRAPPNTFAAAPSHLPGCALATRQGREAYLKHVVSSPEAFRHGYLVVAIL